MSQIILWKNGTGLYAKLQKWFSGKPYSHVAIYMHHYLGMDWVYEASLSLSANPVNLNNINIEIWHCRLDLDKALQSIIPRVHGKAYAFLQILYFVRRKFYESIPFLWKLRGLTGVKKVTKLNNWFPRSQICTEFWYDVVKEAAYTQAIDLYDYLDNTFDGNNLYVSDVLKTMYLYPEYFEKV
jgi:hypothetical protein